MIEFADPGQTSEWLEALDQVFAADGKEETIRLLHALSDRAAQLGIPPALTLTTPYVNTISAADEAGFPGDEEMERRIENLLRYNALAMVARANKYDENIGGHMASYASLATLFEVGFNHFFRASIGGKPGDMVYFQGHSSPGIYARAFLERRLSEQHLINFRHELREHSGLSSYPHPWLMPDFWQFPTVSMGLGPINAIYHARFIHYMENRGLIPVTDRKVWAFLGDGEQDEPETRGALTVASREELDNLIFVVNCNLQRLDGPVRGNGKIIQELEASYRGAGWNVIKCIWGSGWDALLSRDHTGLLQKRMAECVDGEYQAFKARRGAYVREHFFGKYPELSSLVEGMTDDEIGELARGGHDLIKVYNAYKAAVEHRGAPTVILAKTVKGYGLGDAAEGRNFAHNTKKLREQQLAYVAKRFQMPVPKEKIDDLELYHPGEASPEIQYLHKRRKALGGYLPARDSHREIAFTAPPLEIFRDVLLGSKGRAASTTSALNGVINALLKQKNLAKYIVPIIPDEGRTFGMESLFRQVGIYASHGQLYTPVDSDQFLYYRESKDGQLLEEGISEAGSMATFTAAGTAYANFGLPMIPFFVYYSMFGFQRVGDLVWAFADARGKGFMVGGTAGRTTLLGEGLQHMDGHSHVLASTVPTCACYDPAFGYEIAVIVRDGLRRMYEEKEDLFYYLTTYNENYPQPSMPEGVEEGILKGLYRFRAAEYGKAEIHLFGSGPILNEALRAQELLRERFQIEADVWSVTSYVELRREALDCQRWNRLHPGEQPRVPYLLQTLGDDKQLPIIAASDYMKVLADGLAPWLPGQITALGTDGFGRSENREHLRRHFEIDAEHIAFAAISRLARDGKIPVKVAEDAIKALDIDPDKLDAARA
ncbi:pyruvate dehydrogenase (acetyl-transferring), homodimeric type [Edaphobacter albus]|uniref:pyruvate dehydrogenase (acetyl-transferring), homodimeric type n=1 Tax=Edaphobacter sp. 4G125 TaxID=2763071 RepID=UPI002105CAF8|nr:pyruvate dehydrogenase (acetyl-transferring), homodimeric type [Edaphobacter sp. 4G125]